MSQLEWLTHHRFIAITRREYDWVASFSDDVSLIVECLWRLIEQQRIRVTSFDDGHQFGLPAIVDAERRLNESLGNRHVVAVDLCDGTLDLRLTFDNGHVLEIIPNSAGYEAWNLQRPGKQFIAVGGGDLAEFGVNKQNLA